MRFREFVKSTLVLFFVCTGAIAFAQDHPWQKRTPDERAKNQTDMMQKNLVLTPEQNHKVYDINLYYAKEADSAMNMPRGRDRKAERESIEKDKEAELKSVLSAEQFQKYQAIVAEMKQKMEERRRAQSENSN